MTAETRHKVLGVIAAGMVMAAAAFQLSHAMAPKADLFWISLIGHAWFEPEALKSDEAISRRERDGRAIAVWNYPLVAVVSYTLAVLPLPLIWSLGACVSLVAGAGLAVALWGAARAPPFVIALAFFSLLGFLPGPVPTDILFHDGFRENLFNLLAILGNSGEVFSPLAVWPRNTMLVLFMAACARSWAGRSPWPLIACIPLFHVLGGVAAAGLMAMAKLIPNVLGWGRPGLRVEAGIIIALALAGALVLVAAHFAAPFFLGENHTKVISTSAARLIVFAKVTAVLFLCQWGYGWLSARLGIEDAGRALMVVTVVIFAMTAYGATGAWWQRSKVIARTFAVPDTSIHYNASARYYRAILMKTRAAR